MCRIRCVISVMRNGPGSASHVESHAVLLLMFPDITFIMGEAMTCLAQLDSVTLIYLGRDMLVVH